MKEASVIEIDTSLAPVSKMKRRFKPFTLHGIVETPPSFRILIITCEKEYEVKKNKFIKRKNFLMDSGSFRFDRQLLALINKISL